MANQTTATPVARGHRQRADLIHGPITRTLLVFSLPVLGGNLLQSLNGSVNAFWVSHSLGVTAITAIGNANIVMMLMLGAVFGVAMAANIMIGHSVGAGDLPAVKRVMGTAVTFFGGLSVLVALIGFLTSPWILAAMGTPAEAVIEAEVYLRIIFLAMPFMYMFAFLQMAQRGAGDSRTPFWFLVLAVVLDLILNPLLINGVGPFPRMGVAGSAISTFVGNGVSLACLIVVLYRRRSPLALHRAELPLLRPDPELLKALVLRGMPMGLQMLVMSGGAMVMIGFVNSYGAVMAAAYTAASQVWTYLQMPVMALGAAVSSMAAQNVGAGRWDRVAGIARSGVFSGLIVTATVAAVIYLLGDVTLRIFLPAGSEALPLAHHINDRVLWGFVLFSVTFALSGVVRATGAVWAPLIILFLSMYLIRIPFAALLTPSLGAEAIWWSFPLGTIASSLLTTLFYLHGGWKKARMVGGATPAGSAPDAGQGAPAVDAADADLEDAETNLAVR